MPRPLLDVRPAETHDLAITRVRVLDDDGQAVGPWAPQLDAPVLRCGMRTMLKTRACDARTNAIPSRAVNCQCGIRTSGPGCLRSPLQAAQCRNASPIQRVRAVQPGKFGVDGGRLGGERLRPLEERFGHDREELGRFARAIAVDHRRRFRA